MSSGAAVMVRTYYVRVRGLKRFCSVRGGKAQEYVDISRLADDAMDKIGQIPLPLIWGDAEMASISGAFGLAGSDATRRGHPNPKSSPFRRPTRARKSLASGKSVPVRVDLAGRGIINKK